MFMLYVVIHCNILQYLNFIFGIFIQVFFYAQTDLTQQQSKSDCNICQGQ